MRVMVTGAAGFIGSHVVDKLCDRGVDVRVFDLGPPSHRSDIDFFPGSVLDVEQLCVAMRGIDAVIHLAAVADVKDVFESPSQSENINTRGTANVLEAARRTGLKRVIYGSTTWVYSDAIPQDVDEETPLMAPSHLYTATKLIGEYYCHSYAQLYGLEPTVLRFGIPYGPRARGGAVIPIFVEKALNGETITLQGDGLQFRKFVYVEDLAEGIVLALKPIAANRIYNLDGKEKITIRQIAETVQEIVGNANIEYVPARPGDFAGKEVSSVRALDELGWQASTPFEEGVRCYIEWYRDQLAQKDIRWQKVDADLR